MIKTTYCLFSNLDLFFCINLNLFFIKILNKLVIFKMPSKYFYKSNVNAISFLFTDKNLFMLFYNKFFLFYNKFFFLYFIRLRLKGLGFRIRQFSKSVYRFFFTLTNYYYFFVPKNVILKVKSRKLFFISLDLYVLRTLIVHLLLLKKLTVYRIRGLLFPRQLIVLKPGKKRF